MQPEVLENIRTELDSLHKTFAREALAYAEDYAFYWLGERGLPKAPPALTALQAKQVREVVQEQTQFGRSRARKLAA